MANRNRYKEKRNPGLTILYILVILALLAALAFMYKTYREKRMQYQVLVEEASQTEKGYDIETRKGNREAAEETAEVTAAPTATAVPTEAPTEAPTDAPTEAPAEAAEPEAGEAPDVDVFIPEETQNDLVDESLSKGIN